MAIESRTVREGTTDQIEMQLLAGNSAIDLSSIHHVELELRDNRRNVYRYSTLDASPRIGISDASEGKVYFEPLASTLKSIRSPYNGYWFVFETSSRKYSVPEENEFRINVRGNW
jgi:hypothetical protein